MTTVVLVVVTATTFTVLPDRRDVFLVVFKTLLSAQIATVLKHVT